MENQIDPKLSRAVSTTQKLLGEHVSKPVLSDKYLAKPPFRFLHEIFTNVISGTGFLKGAFTPSELKYESFSSVDDKRAFLKKAIDAIETATGEKCDARPSKILSGKEAEKTNGLLQLLAKGIKVSSEKELVKKESKRKESVNRDKRKEDSYSGKKVQESKTSQKTKPSSSAKVKEEKEAKSRTRPLKKSSTTSVPESDHQAKSFRQNHTPTTAEKRLSSSKTKSIPPRNEKSSKNASSQESIQSGGSGGKAGGIPKKPSLSNLKSKQGLLPKKSSSSKLISSTKNSKTDVKQTSSQEKTKITKKDSSEKVGSFNQKTIKPEEIPLQRPVTRTKYRQKTTGDDLLRQESVESLKMTPTTEQSEIKAVESENAPDDTSFDVAKLAEDSPSPSHVGFGQDSPSEDYRLIMYPDEDDDLVLDQIKFQGKYDMGEEGTAENSLLSGRSSSSEDVITEQMNEKIMEWSTALASNESEELLCDQEFKTGWIPHENPLHHGQSHVHVSKVFESTETDDRDTEDIESETVEDKFIKSEDNQVDCNIKATLSTPIIVQRKGSSEALVIPDPQFAKRPFTVLLDNGEDDEDDDAFIVQEKMECDRDLALERIQQGALSRNLEHFTRDHHRGLLVNQIIETQRELEKMHPIHHQNPDMQTELAQRDREAMREVYLKQIESLKEAIQKMAKCANPLANIAQRSQDDACLMEIEFRKLRQENERLQRRIDDAKTETSQALFPLTEELALLDNRIGKMEGAIIMAKQRLHIMDEEYAYDFIEHVAQTPTGDEEEELKKNLLRDIIGKEDDEQETKPESKSLIDVFRKGLCIHEQNFLHNSEPKMMGPIDRLLQNHREHTTSTALHPSVRNVSLPHPHPPATPNVNFGHSQGSSFFPAPRKLTDRGLLASSALPGQGNVGSYYTQFSGMLPKEQTGVKAGSGSMLQIPQTPKETERPIDKEIRPPWWD